MPWPELRISSWEHFTTLVAHLEFGPVATFPHLYRGQSQANWTLEPSLVRELPRGISEHEAAQIEEDCRRMFSGRAHLHVPEVTAPQTDSREDWWALMQHHGAPTRLLDFTASIYVAAYFASVDDWDVDGAIWLFHVKTLVDQMLAEPSLRAKLTALLRHASGRLVDIGVFNIFRPIKPSHRMIVQQGYFLFHQSLLTNITDFLDMKLAHEHCSGNGEVYRKLIVPKELKPLILRHLRAMNITAASLFPGVDGLGFSARELARLSGAYPRPIGPSQ